MALTGEIRMIQYGVIPSAPYFSIGVGQMVGGKEMLKVIAIVREHIIDGECEYHIQCIKKRPDTERGEGGWTNPFVWKTYFLKPDWVQYFAPDEKHDYITI